MKKRRYISSIIATSLLIFSYTGSISVSAAEVDTKEVIENKEAEAATSDMILNVEPNMNKAHLYEKVVVDLTINNIEDIYATEAQIKYDSSKLEFLGFDEVEGVNIIADNRKDGELNLILASSNIDYPMVGKSTIIKMNFRGIDAGDATVEVSEGTVADGIYLEKHLIDAERGHATINISDKKFTLVDLATIARHYGEDPVKLLEEGIDDLDLNHDGKIDKADYEKCQELMLQNPDNEF